MQKFHDKKDDIAKYYDLIQLALLPVSCLIKSHAFEEENECRIIYITSLSDDKVNFPKRYEEARLYYIDYKNIDNCIKTIRLAPKCQPHHEIWINRHMLELGLKDNVKVTRSPIKYN